MAAPATTASSTPAGIHLSDGYSTKIAFERDPDVSFWEKTVAPPGLDGGDPIETTTMHNATFRTMRPRALYTLSEMTTTVAYDPNVYNNITDNLLNQEGSITIHFLMDQLVTSLVTSRRLNPRIMRREVNPKQQSR